MIIIKPLIFAFIFFTVFDVFAQDQTNIFESIGDEETDQKIIEQYSSTDVVNTEIIKNAEQIKVYVLEKNSPPSIEYHPMILTTVGIVVLGIIPSNSGGKPNYYSVSPALPRGLILNPSTGVICGIPMEVKEDEIYTIKAINTEGESSFGLMLSVGPPIDVENSIFIQMKMYPDPVEDFLCINGENGIRCVEVYNVLNQLVYCEDYNNFDPLSRKLLELSKLETGTYFLTLFKGNELSCYTILKEESSYTIFKSKC